VARLGRARPQRQILTRQGVQAVGVVVMNADAGTFAFSGQNITADLAMSVATDTYAFTGQAVTFDIGQLVVISGSCDLLVSPRPLKSGVPFWPLHNRQPLGISDGLLFQIIMTPGGVRSRWATLATLPKSTCRTMRLRSRLVMGSKKLPRPSRH